MKITVRDLCKLVEECNGDLAFFDANDGNKYCNREYVSDDCEILKIIHHDEFFIHVLFGDRVPKEE